MDTVTHYTGYLNLEFGGNQNGGEAGGIPGGMDLFGWRPPMWVRRTMQVLYVATTIITTVIPIGKAAIAAKVAIQGALKVGLRATARRLLTAAAARIPTRAAIGAAMQRARASLGAGLSRLGGLFRRSGGVRSSVVNRGVGNGNPLHWVADQFRTLRLRSLHGRTVREVDAAIAAGNRNALQALGAGRGEIQRVLAGGSGAAKYRGSIIDTAVKSRASQTFGLRGLTAPGRFQYGPDFWNPVTRRAWDMTTVPQWGAHVTKYITNPATGRPVWRQLIPLIH